MWARGMMLGGKRMKPLGRIQWAGILLGGGSVVLTVLAIALMDTSSLATASVPLNWWLLAGIAGLLGGGVWVQATWKTQQESSQYE
jgi:hypothetical protein